MGEPTSKHRDAAGSARQRAAAEPGPKAGGDAPKVLRRSSGLLLHPSSLPGRWGIGSLGAEAHAFVEWLARAGQRAWQVLPLGPTGYGNSPYAALSAFAGNPHLIDLAPLCERGFLRAADVEARLGALPSERVDFGRLTTARSALLHTAWDEFKRGFHPREREAFHTFCDANNAWLEDWSRFEALKALHNKEPWTRWPAPLRDREPAALAKLEAEHGELVGASKLAQWLFSVQWAALRELAAARGISIIGDLPIFVAHDSADVWAHRDLFLLDAAGQPTVVAGVPPDYFSATGQLWGNPLYRWDVMAQDGYAWWLSRLRHTLTLVDRIRLDHFRGFEAYWEIPGGAKTAVTGRWVPGPGKRFFAAIESALGRLPILAEDLGVITPEVEALRDGFKLPGMKVLQFAFSSDGEDPFLPHNHIQNAAVYLGTHDNDTTCGWLAELRQRATAHAQGKPPLAGKEKTGPNPADWPRILAYLGLSGRETSAEITWTLIRWAEASVAETCILSAQDVLGLGGEARMNTPGEGEHNWEWRALPNTLDVALATRLRGLTEATGRCRPAPRIAGGPTS